MQNENPVDETPDSQLLAVYRSLLQECLALTPEQLTEQADEYWDEIHREARARVWWRRALKFTLQLACFLVLYGSIVYLCVPENRPWVVKGAVQAGRLILGTPTRLLESIPEADRRSIYNSFAFYMEYVYYLEPIPEPGVNCRIRYIPVHNAVRRLNERFSRELYNALLSRIAYVYYVKPIPDPIQEEVDAWYKVNSVCAKPEAMHDDYISYSILIVMSGLGVEWFY